MLNNLWLPETSSEEYEGVDRQAVQVAAFARLLKDIDSRLDLIWVKPQAVSFPIPGRWYIVRRNDWGPDSHWVVQNEDGTYCEPDGRHLEALKARDMHAHPEVYRRHRMACEEERRQRQWAKDEKRREFREKLNEKLKHLNETSVSVSKEIA